MMAGEVLSYQFDDVVIDLRAGRVLKAGVPVALEPKAYDLLVLLVARAGALVTRQDVLDRVWVGVYVTDNAVARVVAQVRRGIGDSALIDVRLGFRRQVIRARVPEFMFNHRR